MLAACLGADSWHIYDNVICLYDSVKRKGTHDVQPYTELSYDSKIKLPPWKELYADTNYIDLKVA